MSESVGITEVLINVERESDGKRTHIPADALKVVVFVVDGDRALACADLNAAQARALARDLDAAADQLDAERDRATDGTRGES